MNYRDTRPCRWENCQRVYMAAPGRPPYCKTHRLSLKRTKARRAREPWGPCEHCGQLTKTKRDGRWNHRKCEPLPVDDAGAGLEDRTTIGERAAFLERFQRAWTVDPPRGEVFSTGRVL